MRALPTERLVGAAETWIDGLGVWGPVALGAIYIAAALLFVPGSILTLVAGAIYGLVLGTIIVSIASTTAAALALLISRHVARDAVRRKVERSPKLAAVDEAIGEQSWKIVALLRLSPAVPFSLQNYLYDVTAVRFWPAVLASWVAMLPGTFMFVYLGSLGRTAATGGDTSGVEWALRGIGLLATIAVTIYVARLTRNAINQRTKIASDDERTPRQVGATPEAVGARALAGVAAMGLVAIAIVTLSVWAFTHQDIVRQSVERVLGIPPTVIAQEAYDAQIVGSTFDHSTFDALLRAHVDDDGWVDYEGIRDDVSTLDSYLRQLTAAPFDALSRDEKLALLINAYNAFTIKLLLDYYPVASIRDIPDDKRWDAVRWQLGPHTWSLNQIEHEQIRPKFADPRIHFALVCAAVGCPPLRNEAYTAAQLEQQLTAQATYIHSHPRWFRFDQENNVVQLTALYDWYGGDFNQHAPTILEYASRSAPALRQALGEGHVPRVRWLDYDWRLNSSANRKLGGRNGS
ncbi:MAG: DUF547 domain-containing protein [Acidobacteria bacterium]|nr:DUF547 domain-containing protein [Acidobacteriota bacterium]